MGHYRKATFFITVGILALALGHAYRSRSLPGIPDGMTVDEFLETRGRGHTNMENIRKMAKNIKSLYLKPGQTLPDNTDDKFDDLVFTEEQLQVIEEMVRRSRTANRRQSRRWKRKVANFENPSAPFNKWLTTEIFYLFDGTHTTEQQADIRAAMDHWAEKTCVRFSEVPDNAADYSYIYFTRNDTDGCWSYVGRITSAGPQILNLATGCFLTDGRVGTIVHELGHALGFVHEHTRDDRDGFITINEDNIIPGLESQFTLWETDWLNVEIMKKAAYDMSSIMHYSPKAFTSNGDNTIIANDPLYAGNMGQRRYLTFWDAYAANLEYCSSVCPTQITCQRNGFQDPNNCGSCVCPDGFTGQYCEQVEVNKEVCANSGSVDLGADTMCLDIRLDSTSKDYLICDWHVRAQSDCTIEFWFESLNLACSSWDKSCYDYVEVKYNGELTTRGPRFCCTTVPDAVNGTQGRYQTSDANEVLVNFASFYTVVGYMPSFKLCAKVSNTQCLTATTTTTTTTTESTTSTPTTPTTTTTTTTTQPTTTTTTTTQPTTTTTQPTTTTTQQTTTTTTTTQPTTTTTQPTTTTTTTPQPTTTTTTTTRPTTTTTTTPQPTTTTTKTTRPTTTTTTTPQPTTTTTSAATTTTTPKPTTTTRRTVRTTVNSRPGFGRGSVRSSSSSSDGRYGSSGATYGRPGGRFSVGRSDFSSSSQDNGRSAQRRFYGAPWPDRG